jgi:hypothetical protein
MAFSLRYKQRRQAVGVDDLKADVGCIFWSLGNICVTAFGSKLSCYMEGWPGAGVWCLSQDHRVDVDVVVDFECAFCG